MDVDGDQAENHSDAADRLPSDSSVALGGLLLDHHQVQLQPEPHHESQLMDHSAADVSMQSEGPASDAPETSESAGRQTTDMDIEDTPAPPPQPLTSSPPPPQADASPHHPAVVSPTSFPPNLVADKLKNSKAILTERDGTVQFRFVENDGLDESMILLAGLKAIFQKQLPNMPKEYISRLVYDRDLDPSQKRMLFGCMQTQIYLRDRNHHHMAVVRLPMTVLGGITYRPFDNRNFAEIVFCAITSTEQVQGYGSRLMSHVKDYVRERYDIWNFLTYADNYAIGYFKKQGFTTEITLDKQLWVGYIKDYEGGTLMQCTMISKIRYIGVVNTIVAHRWAVFKRIKEATKSDIVYPGLTHFRNGNKYLEPEEIPGLMDAGWLPGITSSRPTPRERGTLYIFMKKIVTELKEDDNSWPFLEPVAGVPDYYDIITEPMDFGTLEKNVETDKYSNSDEFHRDVMLIFNNCRTYNQDSSPYVRCATRVEKLFKERFRLLKAEMRIE